MKLPSNELLSEVLDKDCNVIYIGANNLDYQYEVNSHGTTSHGYIYKYDAINIYELQHKMKEWAYKNSSYYIESYINSGGSYAVVYKDYSEEPYFNCIADTEFEAVIMASEFILKEIA